MIPDRIELIVQVALDRSGIVYTRDDHRSGLDFYLPKHGVYIECKQFHTVRSIEQLSRANNIILIQGIEAAILFDRLIK